MMWAFSSHTGPKPSKGHSFPHLGKVKSWCPLKFKKKKKLLYIFHCVMVKTSLEKWILTVNLCILFFISCHAMNTKKKKKRMFRLSSCWNNFFVYCTFPQKKINSHVFKMMLPTMKFVPLPFLKTVCHRETSAWLIVNSKDNYRDTVILACKKKWMERIGF